MIILLARKILWLLALVRSSSARMPLEMNTGESVDPTLQAINAVLKPKTRAPCSLLLFRDPLTASNFSLDVKLLSELWSVGEFEVATDSDNVTLDMSLLIAAARKVRKSSQCTNVVVLSDDPAFLASFAESSLRGRLLVWATRLLVVTRLPLQELRRLLSSSWTFSMMNTIALLMDGSRYQSFGVYSYLPYSPAGAQMVRVASWSSSRGLTFVGRHQLFPQKFTNFHGATVNITALPYRPYWIEQTTVAPNGTAVTTYTGSDGLMMHAMAQTLNFTSNVLPSADWSEVTSKVVERESFIASVIHVHLPQRQKDYDFSYNYEYTRLDFSLAKPSLRPKWQGLYYPLSNEVWLCMLLVLLLTPFLALLVTYNSDCEEDKTMSFKLIGSLLGQSMATRRGESAGSRIFVASWLVFAFVVGTAYRGNLTAALTLPKYPPRVETVAQLVKTVDRVTMPVYGKDFRDFLIQSESEIFHELGSKMDLVPDVLSGLNLISNTMSHLDADRYLSLAIAEHFTLADGSNNLYQGREKVVTSIAGLPIPHDAPYKPQIDRFLMMMIEVSCHGCFISVWMTNIRECTQMSDTNTHTYARECTLYFSVTSSIHQWQLAQQAGLYEKWSEDMLSDVRRDARRRQLERLKWRNETTAEQTTGAEGNAEALTFTHMQGPFLLLLLGLMAAGLAFLAEVLAGKA
ncbi:glutamate receptor ionotropic, delta-1-like [Penaeus monodon]|uniref:glutamate receptor ionotropic, delta-1-like n=1 Tax=Penaeus monodon TaxID=6687 RepID=UPI0018A78BE8|nr:glutamate receptor ionotropic, delta-1-like [Penaeus monodon]